MNAAQTPHVLETAAADGQHLRCTFSRTNGLFTHSVAIVEGDVAATMLQAVNRHDDGAWPASPPWQELHVHQQADGSPALMLVGRAGSSHWSMSVSVDGRDNSLLFDVACRLRESAEFLGGTYVASTAPGELAVTAMAIGEAAPAVVNSSSGRVVIDATDVQKSPGTVRWAYRIKLAT